ncbi:MAG: flagellar basal-body rod protein FlgG [Planctomycetota bacterium]|nr:MAG: flagellar basal-body rod protein FlgG [Planctomycetota bacterium]
MPRALWSGASGMRAQQTNVDVIANNIANVNTTGFKRQRVEFQDLFYDVTAAPGITAGDQGRSPTGKQIGNGVEISGTPRIFSPGNIEVTNVQTNMAIEGPGFFRVTMPDGTPAYTRAGDFLPDANGDLVTPDGYYLEPRITIPENATQVSISPTGTVVVLVDGDQANVGDITLTNFRNPAGLVAIGRNLFVESVGSGPAQEGNALTPGFGAIRGSAIEKSNVEAVTEMVNLIVAQRAFEMNTKSIRTTDQMMQTANEIVR